MLYCPIANDKNADFQRTVVESAFRKVPQGTRYGGLIVDIV